MQVTLHGNDSTQPPILTLWRRTWKGGIQSRRRVL